MQETCSLICSLGTMAHMAARVYRSEGSIRDRVKDFDFHSESHLQAIKLSTRYLMVLKFIFIITLGMIIFLLQGFSENFFFAKHLLKVHRHCTTGWNNYQMREHM